MICEYFISSVQFSSFTQSCLTLCDPMDCSTPVFPVHLQLLKLAQIHVQRVSDAVQPFHPVIPFSSCLQSFPASGSFQMSQLSTSGGQSIGVSAPASVLPMNTQESFRMSFRMNWLDLLAVPGTLKSLLQQHSSLCNCNFDYSSYIF